MKILTKTVLIFCLATGAWHTYLLNELKEALFHSDRACQHAGGIKSLFIEGSTIQYVCNERKAQMGVPYY